MAVNRVEMLGMVELGGCLDMLLWYQSRNLGVVGSCFDCKLKHDRRL